MLVLSTTPSYFGRQMHGDKKQPLNGVTNYGRVWGKGAGKQGLREGHWKARLGGRVLEREAWRKGAGK